MDPDFNSIIEYNKKDVELVEYCHDIEITSYKTKYGIFWRFFYWWDRHHPQYK